MAKSEQFYDNQQMEDFWAVDRHKGQSINGMVQKTRKILDGGLLRTTLGDTSPSSNTLPNYDLSVVQGGMKYGIMYAEIPSTSQDFIVVAPRHEGVLQEAEDEFDSLWKSREALKKAGIKPFIPEVYGLSATEPGFSAFTMEYLPDHLELIGRFEGGLFSKSGIILPEYATNTPRDKSHEFMKIQEFNYIHFLQTLQLKYPNSQATDIRMILNQELTKSDYFKTTQKITTEIVKKLYLLNQATGCLPRELSLGAGDFMIDPAKDDFDLRLITLRGGLQSVDPSFFTFWLQTHTEQLEYFDESIQDRATIPYQPFQGAPMVEGIKKGIAEMQKVR